MIIVSSVNSIANMIETTNQVHATVPDNDGTHQGAGIRIVRWFHAG